MSAAPGNTILCVSSAEDLGGGEFVLLDAIAALGRRGLRCAVLNLVEAPSALAEVLRSRAIEVSHCPVARFRNPVSALRVLGWFAARRGTFALALANDTRALLYTAVGCRLVRRPYVWYVHDLVHGATPFERAGARLGATRFLAVSRAVQRGLESLGCPAARISVVPNAVDVDRFHPSVDGSAVRRELGIPPSALVVGAVGRILPLKALEVFIEAAASLRPLLGDAVFLIVGDVVTDRAHRAEALRYRDGLRELRERLGLTRQVVFTGARRDLPAVMAALDLLVHPSREESFGRVVVEAMAAGKPVVASAVGGVPEIVEDGVTGYLVPPSDPAALAARICALADPAVRRRMAQAARARAERSFALPAFEARLHAALSEALPGLGVAGPP